MNAKQALELGARRLTLSAKKRVMGRYSKHAENVAREELEASTILEVLAERADEHLQRLLDGQEEMKL